MKLVIEVDENFSKEYKEEVLSNGMFVGEVKCSIISWFWKIKEKDIHIYEVDETTKTEYKAACEEGYHEHE